MAHQRAAMEVNRALLEGEARFDLKRQLADTLQGRIYSATDRNTTEYCVVKETWKQLVRMKRSRDGHRVPEDFENEKAIMSYLSNDAHPHPGFVRILDEWEDDHCYFYAMEGCRGGELFQYIKDQHTKGSLQSWVASQSRLAQRPMKENNEWTLMVQTMFRQLVDCVKWMHDRGVCHLDLSLENSMIHDRRKKHVKIIDFGLGKYFGSDNLIALNKKYVKLKSDSNSNNSDIKPKYSEIDVNKLNFLNNQRVGKTGYMAPEVYDRKEYDARAADIWSLGVMLFMMCIGAPPYEYPTDQNAAFRFIIGGKLEDVLKHWKRLRLVTEEQLDLMKKIFKPENERITMEELIQHPFVGLKQKPLFVPVKEVQHLSMNVDEEKREIIENQMKNEMKNEKQKQPQTQPKDTRYKPNTQNENRLNNSNNINNSNNNDSSSNNTNNNNNNNKNSNNNDVRQNESNNDRSNDADTDMTRNSNNNNSNEEQRSRHELNTNFKSKIAKNFKKELENNENLSIDALTNLMREVEKKRNEILQAQAAKSNDRSEEVDVNMPQRNTLNDAMSIEGEDDQKSQEIDPAKYQIAIDELNAIFLYIQEKIETTVIEQI